MYIGIILIVTGLQGFIFCSKYKRTRSDVYEPLGVILTIIGCLFFVVSAISTSISMDTVTDLQAFYYDNKIMYENMMSKYGDDVVKVRTSSGDNTYTTFPAMYAEKVERYNSNLAYYRKWQNHLIASDFLSTVPDNLKPIHSAPQ